MRKLLTWNIRHGGGDRIDRIITALNQHAPDAVGLTEYRNNSQGERLRRVLESAGLVHQETGAQTPGETLSSLLRAIHSFRVSQQARCLATSTAASGRHSKTWSFWRSTSRKQRQRANFSNGFSITRSCLPYLRYSSVTSILGSTMSTNEARRFITPTSLSLYMIRDGSICGESAIPRSKSSHGSAHERTDSASTMLSHRLYLMPESDPFVTRMANEGWGFPITQSCALSFYRSWHSLVRRPEIGES